MGKKTPKEVLFHYRISLIEDAGVLPLLCLVFSMLEDN